MSAREARYRRLLRWYPASWRAANGEVLLGTLLDAAEAEGRDRPTWTEAWGLRLTGLGERLTLRVGLVLAYLALIVGICVQAMMVTGGSTSIVSGLLPLMLGAGVAPWLVSAAVLVTLRLTHVLLPSRATCVLLISAFAWTLNFLAAWSWSVGFDEADAGLARSPIAAAFVPLFLAAWTLGAVALMTLLGSVAVGFPVIVRWSLSALIGIILAPVLGLATTMAGTVLTLLSSGALIALYSILLERRRPTTHAFADTTKPWRALPDRRRIALFGWSALAISLLGVGFALTGGSWAPGIDGTRAMQLGLGAGSLALLPLLCAVGWVLARRFPTTRAVTVTGAVLTAVGVVVHAVATLAGLTGAGELLWWALIPSAVGVGTLVAGTLQLPGRLQWLVGSAASLAILFPLWGLLASSAFLAPLLGAAAIIWGYRRPRSSPTPLPTIHA